MVLGWIGAIGLLFIISGQLFFCCLASGLAINSERNIVVKMTTFQKKVYDFVKTIPRGKTATYKDVAVAIGHPKAYRAVGSALNKNPFLGKVPCHRVIKSNGQIGKYVLGAKKKIELLHKEHAI